MTPVVSELPVEPSVKAEPHEARHENQPAHGHKHGRKHAHGSEAKSQWLLFNILIPLGIVAGAIAIVIVLGSVEPAQRPPEDATLAGRMRALMPVRVERVRSLSEFEQKLQLRVDGTVVPFREVRVATEVAGRIVFKSDNCEAGAIVNKGELLMKIDPTDYELEAQRLTRLQEQEYEALGEVDQEMVNTKRLIEVVKQDEVLQEREVERLRTMPSGYASEGEIDKAKRALLQATQSRVTSENQLDLLRKRRSRLEASERLAQAQLELAKQNLKRTEIVSPIDGVIVSEDAELNSFVARGNPIVTIEDTTKVEVATSLRMDQLYWILDQKDRSKSGLSNSGERRGYDLPETPAIVEFQISGRGETAYQWDARLMSYDGIGVDANTRTVPVRIVVDNPQQFHQIAASKSNDKRVFKADPTGPTTLVRGMFVTVKLLIEPQTPLVVIPAEGLKPGNRAWQFIPDPSVLDVGKAEDAQQSQADETNIDLDIPPVKEPVKEPVEASDTETFDPSQWEAGRVVNRTSIFPVDSLSIDGIDGLEETAPEEEAVVFGKRKWWVCEVQDQSMVGGAFVVVSPVGSVDSDLIPARIQRPELAESQSQTNGVATGNILAKESAQ
ncbi:Multidrug resistance protein MdtN [Planctomycetes bacterium CA13]|uniref:Multidrug resistance protein MdtN n=2 Tax=Novipirellula herctigrandis TaxID=2527986 RepID=A0A5C5ZBA5_9BACT|nr:Multidrug resistance protein MdtN [Planctomycetes bacterium CA13]